MKVWFMLPTSRCVFWLQPLALLLLVVCALASSAAAAKHSPDKHYKAGIKAFAAEDYAKAAENFAASMQTRPAAGTALYLGSIYLKLGELSKAEESFKQVLQLDPSSPKRDEILKLIAGIAARNVGIVKLTSDPTGATVYLGEKGTRVLGKTPLELTLPPGTHRVIAALDGHTTASREVEVTFGETVTLALALGALPAAALPPARSVNEVAARALPQEVRGLQGSPRTSVGENGGPHADPSFRGTELPLHEKSWAEVQPAHGNRYALKAALVLTSFAVLSEVLAVVVHYRGESLVPDSLDFQRTHDIELGFHVTAGALAAGAIVGYVLEFRPRRTSGAQHDGRTGRLGVAPLSQGGAPLLSGRF